MNFKLTSNYQPTGDQPQAIESLVKAIRSKTETQVLLGVTGSGKTFTMANVIQQLQMPVLVITHNKTLAGQLYQEFRDFFPDNAVSYFVSYYDYYQPEAYIPQTDTYIEKETDINEEIDKLRLAATTNLLSRPDVIVVASVSCIYNLGSPIEYSKWLLKLTQGMGINMKDVMSRLNNLQYQRSDFDFHRGTYRVRGEYLDIFPAYDEIVIRLEFTTNNLHTINFVDPLTGKPIDLSTNVKHTFTSFDEHQHRYIVIYPAKHYLTDPKTQEQALQEIKQDMEQQVAIFKKAGKLLEAHRIQQKVNYDLEMVQEMGYVNGIENYSRYFDSRQPGAAPYTLLDYFNYDPFDSLNPKPPTLTPKPRPWLCIIDESHMTIPQIRGMFNGDQSRKQTLIDFGFRLPSALDNRPLRFDEFHRRLKYLVCTSATPSEWELNQANQTVGVIHDLPLLTENRKPIADNQIPGVVQLLIRPTGLIDPKIEIRPIANQVDDLVKEIKQRVSAGERTLVTTLTKRMAEELSAYFEGLNIKVHYLHSEIETLERMDILENLRLGEYDVVVGINLLREGLDLPEVSLVAILDADKEGFLRSETSLIQTMGRAARHLHGKVIMYADKITGSMQRAIDEVNRRRQIQIEYNQEHGITPKSITKPIREKLIEQVSDEGFETYEVKKGKRTKKVKVTDVELNKLLVQDPDALTPEQRKKLIGALKRHMNQAAKNLNFELAAKLRDKLKDLQ